MKIAYTRPTRALMLVAVVGSTLLGVNQSAVAGLFGSGKTATTSNPSGRIAYRPAYGPGRTKTFYLSNYAGATYPPLLRTEPLVPTSEQTNYTRPYRPFFGVFGGVR